MQTKSKAGRKLNPELAVVSGRIYTSDPEKYSRLILWIWRMQRVGHTDETIRIALQKAEHYLPGITEWWPYLTSMMAKCRAEAHAKEAGDYKKQELTFLKAVLETCRSGLSTGLSNKTSRETK